MAAQYENPSEYINHHLAFFTKQVGEGSFWALNVDSLIVSVILGFVGLGFFYWVAKGATVGVPNKRQAFVEVIFDKIDKEVAGIFHGNRHKFVAPLAFTVFVWVVLMNSMDFLPADWVTLVTGALGAHHGFRVVPTADVSVTFALALSVWLLMIYFAIEQKGFGGFIHELFCAPFGSNPILWPINFLFNVVEYVSKPLSHSLRLFGNMYAGEIIFLLLWLLATVSLVWAGFAIVLGVLWAVFHVLIVLLQAYIFMMLTIVYIQMSHESH
ncbi:MAG: F0F1 ATP synthase subunit A [Usitatibacter sp.]